MEKELNCPPMFGMEISQDQLPNCYFQSNWEMSSIDQNDPFESALSSMVSSPTAGGGGVASNGGDVIPRDGMMIRELIGRLGSICDSGAESCIATGNNSTNNSCYSTPLNSPPKRFNLSPLVTMQNNGSSNFPNYPPNLASLNSDPGFVERAAKFSSFGNNNFVGGEMGMKNYDIRSVHKLESGKLSRVSSNQSIKAGKGANLQIDVNSGEIGDSREESSVSELNLVQNDAKSRKRKSIPEVNEKVETKNNEGSNGKRSKTEDEEAKKENAGDSKNNNSKGKQKNNNKNDNDNDDKEASKPEPPKDYIHVRARRGQATDSHSLAERVRREKISERMKFLQDLVPGCNKVTGKATVLDEIINYVQSLQRQVEFLSMKLATVNPRMDFNPEALVSKDMFSSRGSSLSQTMYQLDENSAQGFPLGFHQSSQQMQISSSTNGTENPFSLNPLNLTGIRRNPNLQLPSIDGFGDSMTLLANFWEDDLQSLVQMGIAQNQTQSIPPGNLPNAQMKAEL